MKKILIFLCSCLCCFVLGYASPRTPLYYYSLGKQCKLSKIANKIAFQKNSDINSEVFLQTLSLLSRNHDIEWRGNDICIVDFKDTLEINQLKRDSLLRRLDGVIIRPVYTINQSTEAILYSEILVKPKVSINIDSLVAKYGLSMKSDKGEYFIYSVHKDSDVISLANQIYETGTCEFSYPHFGVRFQSFSYVPNDTYFPYQITCHNTGQTLPNGHSGSSDADIDAPEAWEITKGSPDVIVAVFDEGVTSNHPDLPNSRQIRLNGSNFGSGDNNDPSPTGNSNHGNACAGVIAATMDNNEGIAGIAPNCKIMPLRWDGASSDTAMAEGIYFAINNGANIISCSWGAKDSSYTSDVIYNAICTAIAQNVIVIFAAGNTANHIAGNNGFVAFPANADIAYLITVGASDRYDTKANYNPSHSLIDFVAPSHRAYSTQISNETFEMYSIDIPGTSGYNPIPSGMDAILVPGTSIPNSGTNYLSYTGCFGGTSHSCPVVAGVVALMLSVNPYLTPSAVFDILKKSSDKVGGYTYVGGRCNEMGYGRVNAYAAVQKALSAYIQGPDYVCDTTEYHLIHPSQSGETVAWSVSNGTIPYPHYSIVGPANQDTVRVACEYVNVRGTNEVSDLPNLTKSLSVTIANSSNNTSETYTKKFRMPTGDVPEVSISNTSVIWQSGTTRTFTVTNCTDVPDSMLLWEVKKTVMLSPFNHVTTNYYTGRTLTYTAIGQTRPYPSLKVTVTNTQKDCDPKSISMNYIVLPRKNSLLAYSEGGILHVSVYDAEDPQRSLLQLNDGSEYSLELWHDIYGCIRTQPALSASEQMDISNLPRGVYVLILKENGNIIAETKVQID